MWKPVRVLLREAFQVGTHWRLAALPKAVGGMGLVDPYDVAPAALATVVSIREAVGTFGVLAGEVAQDLWRACDVYAVQIRVGRAELGLGLSTS